MMKNKMSNKVGEMLSANKKATWPRWLFYFILLSKLLVLHRKIAFGQICKIGGVQQFFSPEIKIAPDAMGGCIVFQYCECSRHGSLGMIGVCIGIVLTNAG